MSNEYLQAAEDANRLLAGFSAVKTLAEAFAKVGQIQQQQAEAEARLAVLQPQVQQAQAELVQVQAETRTTREAAAQAIDEAKVVATDMVTFAHSQADQMLAVAREHVAEAEAHAVEVGQTAEREVAAKTVQRDALQAEIVVLTAKLEAVKAQAQALFGV